MTETTNNEKSWNTFYEKYAELFVNKNKSPRETPMAFGIECGLGWYEILSSLCWTIKQHEDNIADRIRIRNKYGQENDQSDLNYVPVKFDQIKEKYGGLRVYFSGGDDYVDGLVDMAEAISYKTCEVCGNKGEANDGGWISVLCDTHRQESMK